MARNLKKPVTAICKVSTSKSLHSCINYACYTKAHKNPDGLKVRTLEIHGHNTLDNPQFAEPMLKHTLAQAGMLGGHHVQCIRLILSYKNLNYKNPADRAKADSLCNQLLNYGKFKNTMAIIATHADGKGNKLHKHVLLANVNYKDLKPISNWADNWRYISRLNDHIMSINKGCEPLPRKRATVDRSHGVWYHRQLGDSWVQAVINKINHAKYTAISPDSFRLRLKAQGVDVEMFKMRKLPNGKRVTKQYKHPTPKGNYFKLPNGNYARYRKHWSYRYKGFLIREHKLGTRFSKPKLLRRFRINAKYLRPTPKPNKSIHISKPKLTPKIKTRFRPILHINGRRIFPHLHILSGRNIIQTLTNKVKSSGEREQQLLAKHYINKDATPDDRKAVKLNIIDSEIDTIKAKRAKARELKRIQIEKIRRERGLSR